MPNYILVLNAGSSSVKFSVFEVDHALALRWRGQIEGFGGEPRFEIWGRDGPLIERDFALLPGNNPHKAAFAALFGWLFTVIDRKDLVAAGHRVVHGGGIFTEPTAIDAQTLSRIESMIPLAPLHQPHHVTGIRAVADIAPDLLQVACFDTAFHRTLPEPAYTLAIPKAIREKGVRRYGFHGISYENVARALPELLGVHQTKIIAAHLGNGASLCAIRDGVSIDTTMSFTALDGLIMGTRPGAIDPGVLLYLLQAESMTPSALEDLLYKRSGLVGLSGGASDMRTLLESTAPEAALAIDCFVYRIVQEIGALTATLEGLDALVFTAGIGERSAVIRERICARLSWLGVKLDAKANATHMATISAKDSAVSVLIIAADEETIIARYTRDIARAQGQTFR